MTLPIVIATTHAGEGADCREARENDFMTIVRVGTNSRYADGWEHVFGGSKAAGRKKTAAGKKLVGKSGGKASKKASRKKAAKRR